jgi:outer membrane autotransporter protein
MVEQTQTETVNQVFNAVGTRLSGGAFSSSQGMSSGDAWENATVWMQGLANHTKLDTSSKSTGFKADTYGAAFGVEKKIDNDVKAGIGYAYNKTDVNSKGRDTDVKTHTLLAYGEYKPSDWFVNGIASYNWSDYKEKKNVIGNIINADYDVDALGIQVMTGYDLHNQYATITPEAGLRYMHIHGDNYTDTAGQNINFNNSNIITGVAGSKISKTIETESGLRLTPEARFAMTYDLNRAHNKSNVMLPNGSLYSINGKTLDRFGVEIGAGLTAEINYNIEMSLGYEGSFRKDYQSHSGLLDVKYKF